MTRSAGANPQGVLVMLLRRVAARGRGIAEAGGAVVAGARHGTPTPLAMNTVAGCRGARARAILVGSGECSRSSVGVLRGGAAVAAQPEEGEGSGPRGGEDGQVVR